MVITFDEIDSHMNDSENLSNTKWIRDELRNKEYYTNNNISQNKSGTGPNNFSDHAKLIRSIHEHHNKSWTQPVPVYGYMNEIVYIHPD